MMSGAIKLLGRRQAGRSAAHDCHLFAGAHGGRLGHNPAFVKTTIGDRHFDLLNRHWIFVDPQHAGGFARRRANPASELGKIVRGVQPPKRLAPVVAVHQVVPIGNDVSQRATGVAEWHAAIHAPGALLLQFILRQDGEELPVVLHALRDRFLAAGLAAVFDKPTNVTHADLVFCSAVHGL